MAGTIIVDRIESDASYASTINVANRITFSNTVNFGVFAGTAPVAGFYLPTTNNLAFTTASTERMRIDSSGNVGIGTATPYRQFQVGNYSTNAIMALGSSPTSTGTLIFASADSAPGRYVGSIDYNHTSNYLSFTANASERARFNSTGAFVLAGGTTTANGIGITFPATQSASSDANTLDDYEEGTFTPTVSAAAVTYAANGQIGKYTKIGNVVYIYVEVRIATITTNSNNNLINGLPFTSISGIYPKLATMWGGFDFGGTVGVCQVTTNSTVISAGGCTNNGAFVDSFATGFSAGDFIAVTGHYYV